MLEAMESASGGWFDYNLTRQPEKKHTVTLSSVSARVLSPTLSTRRSTSPLWNWPSRSPVIPSLTCCNRSSRAKHVFSSITPTESLVQTRFTTFLTSSPSPTSCRIPRMPRCWTSTTAQRPPIVWWTSTRWCSTACQQFLGSVHR
ncbi:hypothetical protein RvY_03725 [Ramazzottius varieornatus]|uniref:Uncharacterized protein n=1 Tax=Ramazzottius varieornatus TaxID=947166 RepID=A0A1D1USR5_RAMVA|nr:hypothetical protein RvY_03725 [Ramazzottius varieornatus]